MRSVGILILIVAVIGRAPSAEPDAGYGSPRELGRVSDVDILESSGLVASRRTPGAFWTHNDSGDQPRLFLLDGKGKTLATFQVSNANAVDWEDICYLERDGGHFLLIGDVGDNARRRRQIELYLVEEPAVQLDRENLAAGRVAARETIRVRFEDGAHNCESLAFDQVTREILLATKHKDQSHLYSVVLPEQHNGRVLTARRIGRLPIPYATAMDIAPDRMRLIAVNYLRGFEFARRGSESWSEAVKREPLAIKLPLRVQGESVCYGISTRSLFLTSEGRDQSFWEVPAMAVPAGE